MEIVFIVFAFIILLLGIAGCILPVIPGPPIAYLSLLLVHYTTYVSFSSKLLWTLAALAILVQVIDYIVPVWGTKKFGGTKSGAWGSTIGLIVGVFVFPALGIVLGPFGIISILAGPFLGAYTAEYISGNKDKALRSAVGSFIGFLTGTFMKLAASFAIGFYLVKYLWFI